MNSYYLHALPLTSPVRPGLADLPRAWPSLVGPSVDEVRTAASSSSHSPPPSLPRSISSPSRPHTPLPSRRRCRCRLRLRARRRLPSPPAPTLQRARPWSERRRRSRRSAPSPSPRPPAFVEPLVIFLILVVNAAVGVWKETNAEKALETLRQIQSDHAAVRRDGEWAPALPVRELVLGDVVQLRIWDMVPADMRVLRLVSSMLRVDPGSLRVEQGSLTGETNSVNKTAHAVPAEDADIQAKECMVFAGTTIVNGSAACLVVRTGMATEISKINSGVGWLSQEDDNTPLKKKLNEFGEALTKIIGLICILLWLINVKYFLTFELDGWVPRNIRFSFEKCTYYFEIAVALAVAAIPEGLPAVITTCLALGTRKMATKNALVRKLPSVETPGCTIVICSDKTGTLTTNQMSVSKLAAIGDAPGKVRSFKVDDMSHDPRDCKIYYWPAGRMYANLEMIAKVAAVCNDASVSHYSNQYVSTGMPTEAALKVLVEKMGVPEGKNGLSMDPPETLVWRWDVDALCAVGGCWVLLVPFGSFISVSAQKVRLACMHFHQFYEAKSKEGCLMALALGRSDRVSSVMCATSSRPLCSGSVLQFEIRNWNCNILKYLTNYGKKHQEFAPHETTPQYHCHMLFYLQ
ncbi:calcium-transporting ATPase 1, endoplasmic reticulum-type-like [Triticum dicoccoides]|uniref:calcium-transporting ATPase 1, endoplasmic reticulum-type-like n=1 Tax=Triticum dicoccoides TaxID=85692 RepID=UPI001890E04E|nr:calcium-transporting ATPase 1, endoplasmic reticulum-type-like [Triticum dicoccoides]